MYKAVGEQERENPTYLMVASGWISRYGRLVDLKGGVSSDQTNVSSHPAHVTIHFRTLHGPSSDRQHIGQEETP